MAGFAVARKTEELLLMKTFQEVGFVMADLSNGSILSRFSQ